MKPSENSVITPPEGIGRDLMGSRISTMPERFNQPLVSLAQAERRDRSQAERLDRSPHRVRLRQAVLVAADLEQAEQALREALGLGEPFHDPGVGLFGLRNAVFALGDCFIEVVSPTQPNTAAGRHLERHGGDGGYMAIFDLEDLDGARSRARRLDVRAVWEIDLPDISTTHLHPADMRGAIVSIDSSRPYGSWRWGGPDWIGRTGRGAPGKLAGVALSVSDPQSTAARWAEVLGVPVNGEQQPGLRLDDGEVRFHSAPSFERDRLMEIDLQLPAALRAGREAIEVNGVRLRLSDLRDEHSDGDGA